MTSEPTWILRLNQAWHGDHRRSLQEAEGRKFATGAVGNALDALESWPLGIIVNDLALRVDLKSWLGTHGDFNDEQGRPMLELVAAFPLGGGTDAAPEQAGR